MESDTERVRERKRERARAKESERARERQRNRERKGDSKRESERERVERRRARLQLRVGSSADVNQGTTGWNWEIALCGRQWRSMSLIITVTLHLLCVRSYEQNKKNQRKI